jgi:thymidylate synthase (FAD)
MKLLKPYFKIEAINGEDLSLLEVAGRTCYKSEPKGDTEGFIKSKIKAGHNTIIEHISHGFKIVTDYRNWNVYSCINEIYEETYGMQTSFIARDTLYISINPRTLREAKIKTDNWLVNDMLHIVAKKYPSLYDDLSVYPYPSSNTGTHITLLSAEEKLTIPEAIREKHNYMTVRFIVNRGFTHELVRHRIAVYSQESTRYCNYKSGVQFIIPPHIDIPEGDYHIFYDIETLNLKVVEQIWFNNKLNSETAYLRELELGWIPQQARGDLVIDLKTEIVMTTNIKEWRVVFNQRALGTTGKPHPQMSEIMIPLLKETQIKTPFFKDLKII